MERGGIIRWLAARLRDPRQPELITYPLSELLRTHPEAWPGLDSFGIADRIAKAGLLGRSIAIAGEPRCDEGLSGLTAHAEAGDCLLSTQ